MIKYDKKTREREVLEKTLEFVNFFPCFILDDINWLFGCGDGAREEAAVSVEIKKVIQK